MFILGVLTAVFYIPLIEGMRDLLLTVIESLKSRIAVGIYKNNELINAPKEKSYPIGFAIPDEEAWAEEDDDD